MGPVRRDCLFVVAAFLLLGQAAVAPAGQEPRSGKVLIGFKSDMGPATAQGRAEVVKRAGGTVHSAFHVTPVVAANLSEQAMRRLKTRRDIDYVEEDVVLYAIGQTRPWAGDRAGGGAAGR